MLESFVGKCFIYAVPASQIRTVEIMTIFKHISIGFGAWFVQTSYIMERGLFLFSQN